MLGQHVRAAVLSALADVSAAETRKRCCYVLDIIHIVSAVLSNMCARTWMRQYMMYTSWVTQRQLELCTNNKGQAARANARLENRKHLQLQEVACGTAKAQTHDCQSFLFVSERQTPRFKSNIGQHGRKVRLINLFAIVVNGVMK
jgi:hypothetical protein